MSGPRCFVSLTDGGQSRCCQPAGRAAGERALPGADPGFLARVLLLQLRLRVKGLSARRPARVSRRCGRPVSVPRGQSERPGGARESRAQGRVGGALECDTPPRGRLRALGHLGCTWSVLTSRVFAICRSCLALAGEEGAVPLRSARSQGSQNTKDSSNGAAGLAVVSPLSPPRIRVVALGAGGLSLGREAPGCIYFTAAPAIANHGAQGALGPCRRPAAPAPAAPFTRDAFVKPPRNGPFPEPGTELRTQRVRVLPRGADRQRAPALTSADRWRCPPADVLLSVFGFHFC